MHLYGWIPNISSLAFHLIDPLDYRHDRIVGDIIFHHDLSWLSILVDLRDEDHWHNAGYIRIVLVLDKNRDDARTGTLYFFNERVPYSQARVDDRFVETLEKSQTAEAVANLLQAWKESYKKHKNGYFYTIGFHIFSNGIICLRHLQSNAASLSKEGKETSLQQAYYFLKAVFHKDRFHQPANEKILKLYPGKCAALVSNDKRQKDFFDHITQNILQHIAEVRKHHNLKPHTLQELLGILTYAKSSDRYGHQTYKEKIALLEEVIEHELKKKPAYPVDIYQFTHDLKSFITIIFAVLTPGILLHYKGPSNPLPISAYFSDIALPWYGYGIIAGLFVTLLIRYLHDKTFMTSYLFVVLQKLWIGSLLFLKKRNRRFKKRTFISRLVDFEMRIRRLPLETKKRRLLPVGIVLMLLLILLFGYLAIKG